MPFLPIWCHFLCNSFNLLPRHDIDQYEDCQIFNKSSYNLHVAAAPPALRNSIVMSSSPQALLKGCASIAFATCSAVGFALVPDGYHKAARRREHQDRLQDQRQRHL